MFIDIVTTAGDCHGRCAALRRAPRWGQCLRVDNGRPFAVPGADVIPLLALWLIGLGVDVLWNRPRQPPDTAKLERMQGLTANWAEPQQCASLEVLQQHLDAAAELQRSRYRVRRLGGRTRSEAWSARWRTPLPGSGLLILDDTTLDKPYAEKMDLVTHHWSGKHKEVVKGINLPALLWRERACVGGGPHPV